MPRGVSWGVGLARRAEQTVGGGFPLPPSGDEFVVFQRTERAALAEAAVLAHLEGTEDRHQQQRSDDHDESAQRASTRPATNRAAMTTTTTARKTRPENHGDRLRAAPRRAAATFLIGSPG